MKKYFTIHIDQGIVEESYLKLFDCYSEFYKIYPYYQFPPVPVVMTPQMFIKDSMNFDEKNLYDVRSLP